MMLDIFFSRLSQRDACYSLETFTTSDAYLAEVKCAVKGGRLAVIKTQELATNITSIGGIDVWIGMKRKCKKLKLKFSNENLTRRSLIKLS